MVVGASPEKIVPDPRFATLRDVCIIVGTHDVVGDYKGDPGIRNPSLDAILLTQPGKKVAYLGKCCEQKHGKTAPPK